MSNGKEIFKSVWRSNHGQSQTITRATSYCRKGLLSGYAQRTPDLIPWCRSISPSIADSKLINGLFSSCDIRVTILIAFVTSLPDHSMSLGHIYRRQSYWREGRCDSLRDTDTPYLVIDGNEILARYNVTNSTCS